MNEDAGAAVLLKQVHCVFDDRDVLANVSLEVAPGESVCLIGRSGMGKSVTLKLIVGLLKPASGEIRINGESIIGLSEDGLSRVRRHIGFLFQGSALFDSMSLYENLAVPLKRLRETTPDDEIEAIVHKNLADVGLGREGRKMPAELSGGMIKRAGLARALMLQPCVLLADEPVSGLDRVTASEIDDLLLRVRETARPAMVIVTHDTREARRVGDRVAVLDNGGLIAVGRIEELSNSGSALVRELVSEAD